MFHIAGQMAGPNGLAYVVEVALDKKNQVFYFSKVYFFFHGQRRALHLEYTYISDHYIFSPLAYLI